MGNIARLGHEAVDHAVKDNAVIGATAGQFLDALAMQRGNIGQQFDCHDAIFQLDEDGVFGILDVGHLLRPFSLGDAICRGGH